MLPKIDENNFDKNLALVDEAKTIADVKGCTMAQLSLAWVHQQGEDVIPIPGTTKVKNLWENLEARDIVLSDEEMVKLDTIWTKDTYQSTHSTIYGN
jgi:aryl-alcohol dehydrogenase-like predicted oxidoreductase